jgi:hypothetical protein
LLIYEDDKDISKLDKLFPDNTASVDAIDIKHLTKYLVSDFPELDKKTIEYAAKHATNYYHAKNICRCLNVIQGKMLLTEKQIISLFDIKLGYSNDDLQIAIASKNFNAIMYITDHYEDDPQSILYQILRVMTELDKIQNSKYSNSPLKKYAKNWTKYDIVMMFENTYSALLESRSVSGYDVRNALVYLLAAMRFSPIPAVR